MKVTNKQIITAIQGTGGILSQVLHNLNKLSKVDDFVLSRQGLAQRIAKHQALQDAIESERELVDDLAETGFADALHKRQPWAIKEWLKYKGRLRNYTPAMKVDHTTDDKPLPQPVIFYPAELPYDIVKTDKPLTVSSKEQANAQQTTQSETGQKA
ncbi:hypothetical protein [Caudoviricetes sp.]|nr:hypothetical protein [Caudoviricetes sp.]